MDKTTTVTGDRHHAIRQANKLIQSGWKIGKVNTHTDQTVTIQMILKGK